MSSTTASTTTLAALLVFASAAIASDHLDTPSVIADPAADIGDLYAWMSPDGRRLQLVLDTVGRQFSDRIQYVFHVQSGPRFGQTTREIPIVCRFDVDQHVDCRAGAEHVRGDAHGEAGIATRSGRLRVFAGLRNDPFFNNVKATREAYDAAMASLQAGARRDAAGCPAFGSDVAREVLERWRHTSGGPARDFLAGWTTSALVVSVDVRVVDGGGPLLAVWSGTYAAPAGAPAPGDAPVLGTPVDRMGRTLTGNALIGPLDPEAVSDRRKEQYNRAAQRDWPRFVPDIARTLALYDGFDGVCGNAWRADRTTPPAQRNHGLAALLADDRLWIDSRKRRCERYLAIELQAGGMRTNDCGGRRPDLDAVDVYRSLLVGGRESGVDDGVARDDKPQPVDTFPFLAAP